LGRFVNTLPTLNRRSRKTQ